MHNHVEFLVGLMRCGFFLINLLMKQNLTSRSTHLIDNFVGFNNKEV